LKGKKNRGGLCFELGLGVGSTFMWPWGTKRGTRRRERLDQRKVVKGEGMVMKGRGRAGGGA